MSSMQYTAPKVRRLKRLALQEDFKDEDGKPDIVQLASASGLHRDVVRFLLTPEPAKRKRRTKEEMAADVEAAAAAKAALEEEAAE